MKQIFQIEHNRVKTKLAGGINKRGRGFEFGTAVTEQIQPVTVGELEPETAGLQIRRADHSATPQPIICRSYPVVLLDIAFVLMSNS